ncbi:MAG: homoserine O-succinyltransferase [Alphaproteobacteria bacterium]
MPIKIPSTLPAADLLKSEGVFVMDEGQAMRQDIRPLQIAILNLMPDKLKTEMQLARLIGSTALQVELTLMTPASYKPTNTAEEHLTEFYKTWPEVKHRKFDGLVITGAPVEHLPFEEVKYWEELKSIFDWSQSNVMSTFTLCWAAQAALYHFHRIPKVNLPSKMFGLFSYRTVSMKPHILRGFDDVYTMPVSRHTEVLERDISAISDLTILSKSPHVGVGLVIDGRHRIICNFNHLEYDVDTLGNEYMRDIKLGKGIAMPTNYYPNDNPTNQPCNTWRAHAHLLFANWLNETYQKTPFNIENIPEVTM